jgi:endonuclease/exonuclease/phosphatase family metal-dependent hydrolase
MRALTWNIHYWRTARREENVAAVADALAASGADIISLNEVLHPHPHSAGEGDRDALSWVAERLGMHVVFGAWQRWPAHLDGPDEGFGNAILSRWPIAASASHHLSSTPSTESRGLLEARVLLPSGEPFTVYSVHLDFTDEEARVVQFRNARQWLVRDRNRPHLFMGDINAISAWDYEEQPELLEELAAGIGAHLVDYGKGPRVVAAIEKAGYVDAGRRLGRPGCRTHVVALPDLRLDYIFASAPLADRLAAYGIIDEADGVSDHRPVWVEVRDL